MASLETLAQRTEVRSSPRHWRKSAFAGTDFTPPYNLVLLDLFFPRQHIMVLNKRALCAPLQNAAGFAIVFGAYDTVVGNIIFILLSQHLASEAL